MTTARASQLIVTAFVVGALSGAGCGSKKDKDKSDDQHTKNGPNDVKPAGKPLSADAQKALAMFPVESVAVGGVNLAKARDSQLFSTLEPMLRSYAGGSLAALEKGCGLDPLAEVDSIVLAVRSTDDRDTLVVIRGIERKVMSDCIKAISDTGKDGAGADKAGDEAGGKPKTPDDKDAKKKEEPDEPPAPAKLDIAEDGDWITIKTDDHEAVFVWLDDTTIFGGIGVPKADLEKMVAGGKGLDQSANFMAMVGQVDTTNGVWLIARETRGVMGMEFDSARMSVDLFGGLKVTTAAVFAEPADAEAMVGSINKRLDELRGSTIADYMKKLTVAANGNEARLSWELTDEEIASFKEVYKKDFQMQMVWGIAKKKLQQWISPPKKDDEDDEGGDEE